MKWIVAAALIAGVLAAGSPGATLAGRADWSTTRGGPVEPRNPLPPGSLSLGFEVPETGGRAHPGPIRLERAFSVADRMHRGDRLLHYGLAADALAEFRAAREALPGTGPNPVLPRLERRLGNAHWALFGETHKQAHLEQALGHWRWAHAWYRAYGDAPVDRARMAFEIGRAHVALAGYGDSEAHIDSAAAAFSSVAMGLGESERQRLVAILSGRLDPASRAAQLRRSVHF